MRSFGNTIFNRIISIVILGGLIFPLCLTDAAGDRLDVVATTAAHPIQDYQRPALDLNRMIRDEANGLSAALRTARYSIDRSGDTLYASNPANDMRAAFESTGSFKLRSSEKEEDWRSDWNLRSIGHGSTQQVVHKGEWSGNETRVSASHWIESREGPIQIEESFENRPDGLEQVFVVEKGPRSTPGHAGSRLRLVLDINGDLQAQASDDGQTIDLVDKSGEKILRYEKLKVWDANSRELNAKMLTKKSGEVWLEVDDVNAIYPITVDPSFVRVQKLTRVDGAAEDHLGESLAYASGIQSFLAIGAPDADVGANVDQGAVYLFSISSPTQPWSYVTKLTASDGAAGDNFGAAIAAGIGAAFWIGAPNDNVGSNADQGSVYQFEEGSLDVWVPRQKVLATDGGAGDNFGSAILVLSTFHMFVSAPADDVDANTNQGSVYWINQDTGGHRRRLNASDGQSSDAFGISVDGWITEGDIWLTIGAYRDDNGSANDQGSVYILHLDPSSNTWTQPQKLLAPDGALGDNFGVEVNVSDSFVHDLYIGATGDDIGGNSGAGSVYFYRRVSDAYAYDQKLTASDGEPFGRFGSSIDDYSFFDTTIVIGAPFADVGTQDNQGAVYVFNRRTINGNVVFRQASKRTAPDGRANDHFGSALILPTDRILIVGSPDDDIDSDVDQGSVTIMRRAAVTSDFDRDFETDLAVFRPSNGQWWYYGSNFETAHVFQFGTSTDRIMPGDFTGDGKTDIALWRPSNGSWYVLRSEDSTFYAFPFGISTDTPTVGDFDGDSKADATIFRPSNGGWYISHSSGGSVTYQFGLNGDIPVPGDYDDDGASDLAIFRPSNGQWWIDRSGPESVIAHTFGISSDKPVPADYTGDGKIDVAIFRPSNGFWYILRSENGSFYAAPFGTSTDLPAPGDYDSDGKADLAIFRPSDATWYLNRSVSGNIIRQFGAPGDRPVPGAFVP